MFHQERSLKYAKMVLVRTPPHKLFVRAEHIVHSKTIGLIFFVLLLLRRCSGRRRAMSVRAAAPND
jgi:hypothetical protein